MIRQATETDLSALQGLLGQILQVHHALRPDLFQASGSKFRDDELLELLQDPKRPIFVYEEEGQVLGHLFLQVHQEDSSVLTPVKTVFIDDLCVADAARGKGIGRKLYQWAVDWAKKEGAYHLTLHVWNDNQGALRFYEALGMTPQFTSMELILEEDKND